MVPTDTPGFTTRDIHRKLSLRASITSELILEDVRLPDRAALPGVTGMRGPLSCLTEARFGICWGAVGAGHACYLAPWIRQDPRAVRQADRRLPAHPTQARRHDARAAEGPAAGLAPRGPQGDRGRCDPNHVSIGKLNNVRIALHVAREARTILGANGITTNIP